MPPNQLHLPSFKDLVTFCKDDRVTVEASSLPVVRDASQGAQRTAFDRRCSDAGMENRRQNGFDQEQRGNQPTREVQAQSRSRQAVKDLDGRASQQASKADHTDQTRLRFTELSGTLPRPIHTASSSSSSASTRSNEESTRHPRPPYARSIPQLQPPERRSEFQSQQPDRSSAELKPPRGDTFVPPTPSPAAQTETRYAPQTIPSQRSLLYRPAEMQPNGHVKQFEHAHQRHPDHRVRSYSASPHTASADRGRSAPPSPPYVARQAIVVPGSRSHPQAIAPKPNMPVRPATHDGARTFDSRSSGPVHRAQSAHPRSADHSAAGYSQKRTFAAQERTVQMPGGEHESSRMHTVQHRQEANGRVNAPERMRYADEVHRDTRMAGPAFAGFSTTQGSLQRGHTESSAQHERVRTAHPAALDANPQLRYGTNSHVTGTSGPVRQYIDPASHLATRRDSAAERDHSHRQCISPCSPSCPRRGGGHHNTAHLHHTSREQMQRQPQILRTQSEEARRLRSQPAPQPTLRAASRDDQDGLVRSESGFPEDGRYAMPRSNGHTGSQIPQRRVLGGVSVRSQQARQPTGYAISREPYQPYDTSGGYSSGVAVKRSSQGSIRRMSPPRLTRQTDMDPESYSATERTASRSNAYVNDRSDERNPVHFVRTQGVSAEQRYSAPHEASIRERTYSTPQRGGEWSNGGARSSPHRPVIASQQIAPAAAMRDEGVQRNGSVAVQRPAKRLRAGSDTSLFRPARFAERDADPDRTAAHSLQSSPLTRPES